MVLVAGVRGVGVFFGCRGGGGGVVGSATGSRASVTGFRRFFTALCGSSMFSVLRGCPSRHSLGMSCHALRVFSPSLTSLLVSGPRRIVSTTELTVGGVSPLIGSTSVGVHFRRLDGIVPLGALLDGCVKAFITTSKVMEGASRVEPHVRANIFRYEKYVELRRISRASTGAVVRPSLYDRYNKESFELLRRRSGCISARATEVRRPLRGLSKKARPGRVLVVLRSSLMSELGPKSGMEVAKALGAFERREDNGFGGCVCIGRVRPLRRRFRRLRLSRRSRRGVVRLSGSPRVCSGVVGSATPSVGKCESMGRTVTLRLFKKTSGRLRSRAGLEKSVRVLVIKSPNVNGSRVLGCISELTPEDVCADNGNAANTNLATTTIESRLNK